MEYSNLRKIIVGIIIYVAIMCNDVSINAEESTKDRIQKHRAWLNQRTKDRQLVGYVETNDPFQKIKYFKKLIKFKNKSDHENIISFVPHENNVNELTTIAIDTGNKFAYDTVNNNEANKYDLDITNDVLPSSAERNINSNIITDVDKQIIFETTTTSKDIRNNEIERGKIDDFDNSNMHNSIEATTSSIDSKNSLNATSNDVEIERFLSEHIKYKSSDVTIKKSWGKWGPWTQCSRTCGEGVTSQSRECILRHYKNGKRINVTTIALNECIGFFRRFRICNEKKCPEETDLRAEQCSSFNNQSFRGIQYTWEPYIKEDSECELNCKPIDQKYFAKLKDFVIDGTPCKKVKNNANISFDKAVCVEGKCKAVLKNGMISGSGFMNSGNVRCGSSICRPLSGTFLKNPLPNGYVHVTTIPATASNITITELRDSINLLALKSIESEFIINGNYTATPSGKYYAAGAEFKYHRIDSSSSDSKERDDKNDEITEWITCAGPLHNPIHIMVLSQQQNPGIKYEYLIPINFASSSEESGSEVDNSAEENLSINRRLKAANYQTNSTAPVGRKKRKFAWRVVGFQACSKKCGGGIQQPIIRCVRGEGTKAYSPKRCVHLQKPSVNENLMKCNTQPCPAFWKISEWSNCHCGELNEKQEKTRDIKCVQELISGVVIQVNSGACNQDQPSSTAPCECVKPLKVHKIEDLKPLSNRNPSKLQSQSNTQSDQKINNIHHGKNKTKPPKSKKIGVWLTSEWSETCSNECGVGQQFRTIFCDRSVSPNDRTHIERCDLRQTPNTYRECTNESKCHGDWFIGPWSTCQGDCFNASRWRTVVCIKDDGFAEESECDLKSKPATFEDCTPDEMKDCKPKWHFSEWTECSKPCGNGIQKRTVKCLEIEKNEKVLKESKNCKYSERPNAMKYCNTQDCSETTTTYDPRVDLLQNDDPTCTDEFPNCEIILKASLCGYHYYNENCCKSCRSFSNELYL
ncbi:hypothetical protein PVAND_005581 [Polypedilum vanderplanki]|uniref:Uncharacterized protein n=1 Tax=Polypedilum vanderplanki TaxID=319348 RepID=A0A9J6C0F4_POLVA|nr:hypothetical protein PVAND_005581 [Polypedilum vanderplanki]